MSVDQFIQLMAQDPELRQRLIDAASNEERAAMLAEQGIELPTNAQVEARIAELKEMVDVDGGKINIPSNAAAATAFISP